MDFLPHFRREVTDFEAAVRLPDGPGEARLVTSCPGWSVPDLAAHLGRVHRYVTRVLRRNLTEPPDITDVTMWELPPDTEGWPMPETEPNRGPMPANLVDWYAEGAATLASLFATRALDDRVWTWSAEQSIGFWLRMQTIEAATHRWDAEDAFGRAQPIDTALAADAVDQNFEVMAPWRRICGHAPPGSGERFRFRQTDGTGVWTVHFEGDEVRLDPDGPCDVELAGPVSDLLLYLWHRVPADRLEVRGDRSVLDRYFTLVPPM
ncbi:maleylpyruvate isomerase family mycothiol-dependent enzyme [Amycolatopsis nigrescens]|uniref:maleylpyruvate isomerase family mycothiol-dependent enzyme n=1 Tax=Amycolatopsis nigrescens TaxID=381445 RepID=UPI000360D1CC|nr:maleylpyruvate isomerase family mycothiol-dependent enzyme [Amycolatopsis nigrescens]